MDHLLCMITTVGHWLRSRHDLPWNRLTMMVAALMRIATIDDVSIALGHMTESGRCAWSVIGQ